LEGLRNFLELFSLFSSFLRGASCPKSPRVAATAAPSFILEKPEDVKNKLPGKRPALAKFLTTVWPSGASNRSGRSVSSKWAQSERAIARSTGQCYIMGHLASQAVATRNAVIYSNFESRWVRYWGIEEQEKWVSK
jgi:hypothetical protein